MTNRRVGLIEVEDASIPVGKIDIVAYQAADILGGLYEGNAPFGTPTIWAAGAPVTLGAASDAIYIFATLELA